VLIRLVDLTGRTVKDLNVRSVKGENEVEVDLANLNRGIYLVYFNIRESTSVKKLVVE
jgi:hypothetical protein